MCTMISERIIIQGSGKGVNGWFTVKEVSISYDHPFDAPFEHALNLDFTNEEKGLDVRVAVELDHNSARQLVDSIVSVLNQAEAGEHIE